MGMVVRGRCRRGEGRGEGGGEGRKERGGGEGERGGGGGGGEGGGGEERGGREGEEGVGGGGGGGRGGVGGGGEGEEMRRMELGLEEEGEGEVVVVCFGGRGGEWGKIFEREEGGVRCAVEIGIGLKRVKRSDPHIVVGSHEADFRTAQSPGSFYVRENPRVGRVSTFVRIRTLAYLSFCILPSRPALCSVSTSFDGALTTSMVGFFGVVD